MRARVRFRLPDGRLVELEPGDQIGRLWSMALPLDDPRVSEAHAMVSLRGHELVLLALRRQFLIRGAPTSVVRLEPGLEVEFAVGLSLLVESAELPSHLLALEGDALPRQILGGVCSLVLDPTPRLVARAHERAAACIWGTGIGWRVQVGDAPQRDLRPGDTLEVGGHTVRAVAVETGAAGHGETALQGGVRDPLRIIASWDAVQVHPGRRAPLLLSGLSARVVSELYTLGRVVPWEVLARELWNDDADRFSLRKRLDMQLLRLRRRLEGSRIRPDLVRTDGSGNVELLLYPEDVFEERT